MRVAAGFAPHGRCVRARKRQEFAVALPEPPQDPFEKTFRLVCRLDDADIDYVRDTSEWITRCVARALAANPTASADDVTPIVVDMSTRGRWRLMRPETVGEQMALPVPQREG